MHSRNVDGISRLFADLRLSRRRAVTSGGAGVAGALIAAGLGPTSGLAQGATPVAGDDVELLFVQSFGGGTISSVSSQDSSHTLTLEGGLDRTVYFSDRPNRIVGTLATSEFLVALEAASDDPPNAALVADDGNEEMILIVELVSARLDEATRTLTYDVVVLGEEDVDMQFRQAVTAAPATDMTLGTCHLFIDGLPGCISVLDGRC